MKNFEEMQFRLLGFYKDVQKYFQPEVQERENAEKLAELLDSTFSSITDPNKDNGFERAMKDSVFVMRDREGHLYAYWPKEKQANISSVVYNREDLTVLPLEYKSWFTPGQSLDIGITGKMGNLAQTSLFDYLRATYGKGNRITINTHFDSQTSDGRITGDIKDIGHDFLILKDSEGGDVIISKHFLIRPHAIHNRSVSRIGSGREEVPAMGQIKNYDTEKKQGWIKVDTADGRKYYGLKGDQLLQSLRNEDLVVFSVGKTFKTREGKEITPALYVHSPGFVDDLMRLSSKLWDEQRFNAAKAVATHVLNVFPDNEDANEMVEAQEPTAQSTNPNDDAEVRPEAKAFEEAMKIIEEGTDKGKALPILLDLLGKENYKVKDCVRYICVVYKDQYSSLTDEDEKEVIAKKATEILEHYAPKIGSSLSRNLRLKYYQDFGMYDKFMELVEETLRGEISYTLRSRMLWQKYEMQQIYVPERMTDTILQEALYFNPLNSYADKAYYRYDDNDNRLPKMADSLPILAQEILDYYGQNLKEWLNGSENNSLDELLVEIGSPLSRNEKTAERLIRSALLTRKYSPGREISGVMTECIALWAQAAAEKGSRESAIYLWHEMFAMLPGNGYFHQWNLSSLLSMLMGVSSYSDGKYDNERPWQDRRTWKEILSETRKAIHKEDVLDLLYAVGTNSCVLKEVCDYLNETPTYADILAHALDVKGRKVDHDDVSQYVRERDSKYSSAGSKFRGFIMGSEQFAERYESLNGFVQTAKDLEMLATDREITDMLKEELLPVISQYINEFNPIQKGNMAKRIREVVPSITGRCIAKPTEFSMTLLSFLNKMMGQLSKIQQKSEKNAKPILDLQVADEWVKVTSDNRCTICLHLSNQPDSMPAESVAVQISRKGVTCTYPTPLVEAVNGGDGVDYLVEAQLSEEIVRKGGFGFAANVTYKVGDKEMKCVFNPLQVRFHQKDAAAFVETTAKYNYGPLLKPKDPTFVGRQREIRYLVDYVMQEHKPGAQIAVYGQKRCGKSTVVNAVCQQLEEEYADRAWCVYMSLVLESGKGRLFSEADFFGQIMDAIEMGWDGDDLDLPKQEVWSDTEKPTALFKKAIMSLKLKMQEREGWENRRLVLIVDEFSVLYESIKSGKASEQILHFWKSVQEDPQTQFAAIFVGHDITPAFFAEPYAVNSTRIFELMQLTYLEQRDAEDLIIRPNLLPDGKSRFNEEAVRQILYYTDCSPYLIQIFMKEMVSYINEKQMLIVTKEDVIVVANRFVTNKKDPFSQLESFDNLYNPGLLSEYCRFTNEETISMLRIIAKQSNGMEWCTRRDIQNRYDDDQWDNALELLRELDTRKVIERKENDTIIKIKVGLFKEWLIKN